MKGFSSGKVPCDGFPAQDEAGPSQTGTGIGPLWIPRARRSRRVFDEQEFLREPYRGLFQENGSGLDEFWAGGKLLREFCCLAKVCLVKERCRVKGFKIFCVQILPEFWGTLF